MTNIKPAMHPRLGLQSHTYDTVVEMDQLVAESIAQPSIYYKNPCLKRLVRYAP